MCPRFVGGHGKGRGFVGGRNKVQRTGCSKARKKTPGKRKDLHARVGQIKNFEKKKKRTIERINAKGKEDPKGGCRGGGRRAQPPAEGNRMTWESI